MEEGDMNASQAAALLQSISHFFLWRSAQEKKEKGITNTPDRETPTDDDSHRKVLDLLVTEFPNVPPPKPQLETVMPMVSRAFFSYESMRKEIAELRSQKRDLEERLNGKRKRGSTETKTATTLPKANATEDQVTGAETSTKPSPSPATDSLPSKKKARTMAVPLNARISHRKDVPDDVKELLAMVREEAKREKKDATRRISQLENTVKQQKTQLEKPKAANNKKTTSDTNYNEAHNTSFEDRMKELEHFQSGNGHVRVPTKTPGLGRWVAEIRQSYRTAEKDPTELEKDSAGPLHLSQERIDRLNAMGFEWRILTKVYSWNDRYQQLLDFKEKHGHVVVPRNFQENKALGEWVHSQRKTYRTNKIKPKKKAKLEEIGFVFLCPEYKKLTWEERLEECREFRRKHGHLRVRRIPHDEPASRQDKSFSEWSRGIREDYRRYEQGRQNRMNRTKIKALQALDFDFSVGGRRAKKSEPSPTDTTRQTTGHETN